MAATKKADAKMDAIAMLEADHSLRAFRLAILGVSNDQPDRLRRSESVLEVDFFDNAQPRHCK
jgi:hypothetical protein